MTILVYLGTDLLAAWGLNLEFGVAGIANFAFIVLVASGAYFYAVLTLGPPAALGNFQLYIIGVHLPVALAILLAALLSGVLGCVIGVTGLKRLRADYQAMVMLVISILATTVIGADTGLFNGTAGLSLIPNPLASINSQVRGWYYVGLVAIVCLAGYLALRRFTAGPLGRLLRAMREDEDAAIAVGKNVVRLRLGVQAVGGAYAGLSGALLVGFIGGWSPQAWVYVETLALLTAIIVGGLGNDAGVFLGTIIIPVLILQGVQFLPQIRSAPELTADLGWIVLGLLTIAFVFARPQGLIPEQRPRHGGSVSALATVSPAAGRRAARPGPAADEHEPTGQSSAGQSLVGRHDLGGWISSGARLSSLDSADGDQEPLLRVTGLVKGYGGLRAVDDATFTVDAGRITGLIGPNGAGKSTALGLISGFLRADSGQIVFGGRDIGGMSAYRRARLGIVRTFQMPREFRALSTLENLVIAVPHQRGESVTGVLLGKRWWRAEEKALVQRAESLLELFGMADKRDQRAGQLSGGQKRMLEVMRALMADPRLLLLDEPMAGLAPALADRLELACREFADRGLSILLVEHELRAVERLCERVVVMARGTVISEGRMAELRTRKEVQDAYVIG